MLPEAATALILQTVEAELTELLAAHSERRMADGRAAVVRNGNLPQRGLKRIHDPSFSQLLGFLHLGHIPAQFRGLISIRWNSWKIAI